MAERCHRNVQVRTLKWRADEQEQDKQPTPSSMSEVYKTVRKLKWRVDELEQVKQSTPSSMTKVYETHILSHESESPRSHSNPLPSIKCHDKKEQGTEDDDEGGSHEHESQISSCGGKQAENSFSKKLKNVKEHFKGRKFYGQCHHATSSISPKNLNKHMQKLSHHLKSGSDVEYTLLEDPDFHYQGGSRQLQFLYKHTHGTSLQHTSLPHDDCEWDISFCR